MNTVAEFDPQLVGDLRQLLSSLTAQGTPAVDQAMRRLMEAASNYRVSFTVVDGRGRRLKPVLADARSALRTLKKNMTAARDTAAALPIGAMRALASATDAPLGRVVQDLERQIAAVDTALTSLLAMPNKVKNEHRAALALEVALVFRDTLKLKPSSTRDTDPKLKPGSAAAAYARVLRGTLKLAGWPQVDIGPLIDRGLVLLRDPELPHNLPRRLLKDLPDDLS